MKTFRSLVCSYAATIQRESGLSFGMPNSESMRKAWKIYRLKKAMHNETVSFSFVKKDGTIRTANGTLKDVAHLIKGTGIQQTKSVAFFDADKKEFRSFKPESILI